MKQIINPSLVALIWVGLSVVACKASSTSKSVARLRGAGTSVTMAATFKIGADQRLKVALVESSPSPTTSPLPGKASAAITQISVTFPQSANNPVDLTKAANGQILLTVASKVNVSAKITHGALVNADCHANDVGLSTTPVQANFICSASDKTDPEAEKKYPPQITDPTMRKAFDQLALECAKVAANSPVVDPNDKAIVYGCYCPKIDNQLLYENYANSVDAFQAHCLGNVPSTATPLTTKLQQACQAANAAKPAPMPAFSNVDGSEPKNMSCPCPAPTTGTQFVVIKYADLYGLNKPLEEFAKKRSELCPK